MIRDIVISCTCNTGHRYTITPDTIISCTCITVTHILLHMTLLFHIHVPLIHGYTIPLDTSFHIFVSLLYGYSVHNYFMLLHHYYIYCWCTCIDIPVSLLHGSLFLLPELLLFEYSCILITLYTCSCYRITNERKNYVNLLHAINIVNKLAYLPVISTVMPTSSGHV